MENLEFTKMAASGNDFIIINNRDSKLSHSELSLSDVAKQLCERKLSVGADGLLLVEDSAKADFKMRIFNPDGSEVEMCGNGSRCTALYALENNIAPKDMKIETKAGVIDAEVVGLRVKLHLTDPKDVKLNTKLKIGKKVYKIHFINTGVPHVVIFLDNLDKIDIENLGSKIRYHKRFKPEGTNANFVKVLNPKEIKIRTYERGVEAETYACGTGAVASAVVLSLIYESKPHIDVNTKSGEVLRVYFDIKGNNVKNVYLEGQTRVVYKGRIGYV